MRMVNYSFDPTALVAEWPLPDLSPGDRRRIASRLFKAHAAFLRTSDEVYGFMKPMAQAFSGIARVLFHARLLTVELLEKQLRLLVSEAAIAGQWLGRYAYRATEEARTEVFAGYLGHASVWKRLEDTFPMLFAAETAEWKSKLLNSDFQSQQTRRDDEAFDRSL